MSNNKIPFTRFQLRWNDAVGRPECPYLRRWTLTIFGYGLRVHRWLASDDPRYLHDHPWWMLILIIKGGYIDISPEGEDRLGRGSIRFRPAEHRHTVRVDKGGCWSLLVTGPKIRNWGFYVPGRETFLRPLRFFSRYGHHQCDK